MKKKAMKGGLVAVLLIAAVTITAFAAAEHQKNKMEYLPGTTDTVTNLPDPEDLPAANADGKTYPVSSQIPQREGYEFLYWTLDYDVGYKYTVHYKLYEGNIATAKPVHADTYGTVPALGTPVTIDAIAVRSLDLRYRSTKKYEIRPGFERVTVTITHDNYEITIWYQPKGSVG